jgi:uncharacterized circularly permuted ATP-grasp superfamily protein/uncharacterized alpha-E superfamily protein
MTGSTQSLAAMQPQAGETTDWLAYTPSADAFDEAFEATGQPRPHWQPLLQALRSLGLLEITRRWREARDLIRENGVTYNVYGDPRGLERPWQLDPVPLLITAEEAGTLQRALIQRGRVLEAVIQDLYGPQASVAEGILPPELVYANPAFLRSCHGARPCGSRFLQLYAANVGRTAGGTFYVLGDRTQSPSGAGYALENRLVLARLLPDTFRDCRVERLAVFFRNLRDTLRGLAPHNRDNPRVVLLTPGPYNETYFEHAYLARYLGYTLVEGGDLTVRDQRVYLKVLGGLQPVDVIFRRLDDDYCDPLELRPDSFLGVPGLVQAVRNGNVAVANALGSGLLETPALLAFLPRLCRYFLGEELRLPSAQTWWCGQPQALSHVLAHLQELVIKPAFASVRQEPVFGAELTAPQREQLADRIRARPRDYVGQERLTLSTTPELVGNRLRPRHMVMRAYLAAHGDSYTVMPGGLTRVSTADGTMVVSMQRGGGSKDTWVLSSGPVNDFSLLRPMHLPVELTRGGSDLPSRVADNLYWLGRYAERADGHARLLRGILLRLTESSGLVETPELPILLRTLTRVTGCYPGYVGDGAPARLLAPEGELLAIIHDARRPGSLAGVMNALNRVAGMVRDRISNDMWRVLNGLADFRRMAAWFATPDVDDGALDGGLGSYTLSDRLEVLDRAILILAAFGGLAMESVTRGHGWSFLDMGRKLERSQHLVELLRHTLVQATHHEAPLLEALLEIADSLMTYRRRYQGSLQTGAVLDLLLADLTNPRSLAFQLAALADDVESLPRDASRAGSSPEQRLVLTTLTTVRLADIDQLARTNAEERRDKLDEFLSQLAADLPALSDALTHRYLSHLQASRHLSANV